MAEEKQEDLLSKIRQIVDAMAAVSTEYEEGDLTRTEATAKLVEYEAAIKALDPEFPIQNAEATLDEVDRMLADGSEYYESSEYEDDEDY